jgi:hypothetical protein
MIATFLVIACSSGSSTSNAPAPPLSAADFNAQYCDLVGACCVKFGRPYSQSTCVGVFAEPVGATFDSAAGTTCINAIQAASKEASFCDDLGSADDEAFAPCVNVYKTPTTGTVPLGGACTTAGDCVVSTAGLTTCEPQTSGAAKCRLTVRAKENDACDGVLGAGQVLLAPGSEGKSTVSVCWNEDGLFCPAATNKCTKLLAIGATCSANDIGPCAAGAECHPNACTALAPIGAACTPSATGLGDGCDFTRGYCDDTSKTCTALVPIGAPCSANKQCGSNSLCTNGKCEGGALVNTKVCGN